VADEDRVLAAVSGFAAALREARVPASTDRVVTCVAGLAALDPTRRADVYWAGRLAFCAAPQHLPVYDRVFAEYFTGPHRQPASPPPRAPSPAVAPVAGEPEPDPAAPTGAGPPAARAAASAAEVLRHRDIAGLSAAERAELDELLRAFRMTAELRTARRRRPARRGPVDPRRTVRAMLAAGGEPVRLRRHRPRRRPRRLVLLVDVSGSMSGYADALLRFAHAAGRGPAPVEVFTVGTRLTRVTRELAGRDPDTALRAAAAAVPDWSGGTRLGELLEAFLAGYGHRGLARGAVVVMLSDGWERGDARLLGEQMGRLSRLAHRVVWANPRKGHPGYAPLAAGMAAALPHVDDFVAGHSLAALQQLAAVVAGAAAATPGRSGA
jgi:uncharacterized protein with von Willebrand factor type A (vWA) domain